MRIAVRRLMDIARIVDYAARPADYKYRRILNYLLMEDEQSQDGMHAQFVRECPE